MEELVEAVLRLYLIVLYTVDNGSMIEYPSIYDRLHTAEYSRNISPTKRVRYSL
jgi:hypothetical protein